MSLVSQKTQIVYCEPQFKKQKYIVYTYIKCYCNKSETFAQLSSTPNVKTPEIQVSSVFLLRNTSEVQRMKNNKQRKGLT